jgi:hypothetical protein
MMAASTNDCSPSWSVYIEYLQLLNIYQHVFVCKVDLVSNEVGHILAQLGKSGSSQSCQNRDSGSDRKHSGRIVS